MTRERRRIMAILDPFGLSLSKATRIDADSRVMAPFGVAQDMLRQTRANGHRLMRPPRFRRRSR